MTLTAPGPRVGLAGRAKALRIATVIILVAGWELVSRGPLAGSDYLAPPSRVMSSGMRYVLRSDTLRPLWITTQRFLLAFLVAAVTGVLLGVLLGRLGQHLYPAARDVVSTIYALPLVPFYPLFVLWLGLGQRSEIAFGAVHGAVPVVLATMGAAAGVERTLLGAASSMGATRRQRVGLVVLPAIVPDIVGALRVGAALSLLGVLLAELMISVDGVGNQISQLIANVRAPELDAVILTVCVGAVLANSALSAAERRLSRWR